MIKSHVTVEFYKADPATLADADSLKTSIDSALASLGIAVNEDTYYQFQPEGVTATVVAKEMHFNIHTWPEHQSCAIDLYSSKGHGFTSEIAHALKQAFQAQEYGLKTFSRQSWPA